MSLIRNLRYAGVALSGCVILATPAAAGVTEFFEPDMLVGSYSTTAYAGAGFTTTVQQRVGLGGGDAIMTTYSKVGASTPLTRFHLFNDAFVYDPSVQGEILSIDASFDQLMFLRHDFTVVNLAAVPALLRLIAEQDGKVYVSSRTTAIGLPANEWFHISATGIAASEFLLFNANAPFAALSTPGLDFGGSAITFGLELLHFGVNVGAGPSTGAVNSAVSADNLRITLHTADPVGVVPEPATWALMIGGFGIAGATLRRSRRLSRSEVAA